MKPTSEWWRTSTASDPAMYAAALVGCAIGIIGGWFAHRALT